MAAPSTRYARSGDVHLAYQVIGDGPRDLVLALDWASHLEVLWEQPFVQELVSSLERFARVLWFDMRGVGLSDRALEAPVTPEDWLDDVAAVMDAAGSERAALSPTATRRRWRCWPPRRIPTGSSRSCC